MDITYFSLPEQFSFRGKISNLAVESYRKDEVQSRVGRWRIVIELQSNKTITAAFDDEAARDKIFALLDRFLTGKDKIPQFDILEER
jgi:hypothetical protein